MKASDDPSRYCKGCRYPLTGLVEHRCPECGREFDPDDPRTWSTGRTPRWVRLIILFFFHPLILLALGWGIYILLMRRAGQSSASGCSIGLYVSGAMALVGIVLLIRKRWTAIALVFLNPACIFCMIAATEYYSGTGTILSVSPPVPSFSSVFPRGDWFGDDFEIYSKLSIDLCLQMPEQYDWFRVECNNATLVTLGKWFGPAPGTYDGPLPTPTEALQFLESGERIDIDELRRNQLTVNGNTYTLPRSTVMLLLDISEDEIDSPEYWEQILPQSISQANHPVATVIDDHCLLFCLSQMPINYNADLEIEATSIEIENIYREIDDFQIMLIDVVNGNFLRRLLYLRSRYPKTFEADTLE